MSLLNKGCRYEDLVEEALEPVEVLVYDGEQDYQGSASVIVVKKDGTVATYAWSWGSCSGCDTWEAADATKDAIIDEIRHNTQAMDPDTAITYLKGLVATHKAKENEVYAYPEYSPEFQAQLEKVLDRLYELAYKEMAAERRQDATWNPLYSALKDALKEEK